MSVTEIKAAISDLGPEDRGKLITWLEEYQARSWDAQIENDLESGRLDKVLAEVDKEYEAGLAEPL
jgi:hypothetical protein